MSITLYKVFLGKIYSLIDSINPCRNATSFQRQCGVLWHLTTSCRRWNNIACLEGKILLGMNCLIMLGMNWVISIFGLIFLKILSSFCWSGKSLPFLSLAIEKSEFKVKCSYIPHITKVQYYHTNPLVLPVQPSLYEPQIKLPVVIKMQNMKMIFHDLVYK